MISFEQFEKMMAFDIEGEYCIEVEFFVHGSEKFSNCGLGKMPSKDYSGDLYWYGLTSDGKNEYDYRTFKEMANARVFDGKSLREIWNDIELLSIDGCEPEERVSSYISMQEGKI